VVFLNKDITPNGKQMLSFKTFLAEEKKNKFDATGHKTLVFSDIDDAIFHTSGEHGPKVLVKDKQSGKTTHELSSSEFNSHHLEPHQHYDFSQFKSSEIFSKSKPVRPVLAKVKAIQKNGGKVVFNTARSDMDDREKFLDHFKKHGVDIDNSHVHRTGNDTSKKSIGEKKNDVVKGYLSHNPQLKHLHLIDDHAKNLDEFLKLKDKYPHVKFTALDVQPEGTVKRYNPEGK
jgi:hypothetical protein